MVTAVIGLGTIGGTVARRLAEGGEAVIAAAGDLGGARRFAEQTGSSMQAASVEDAINRADAIVFAVWFDVTKQLVEQHRAGLAGKVVVDPSNPIKPAEGGKFERILPDGVSSGQTIAHLLPEDAHFVKAFGTLSGEDLAKQAGAKPQRVLFYATDDQQAEHTVQRLITAAGFAPLRAGGVATSLDLEVFGRLHQMGGLNGKVLTSDEADGVLQGASG